MPAQSNLSSPKTKVDLSPQALDSTAEDLCCEMSFFFSSNGNDGPNSWSM